MLPIHQSALSNLRRGLAPVVAALVLTALAGCADLGYLMQSASGHVALMRAAKPVEDWQRDPQTSPQLKARLALAQQIRRFATSELALPDNASYTQYADLKRRAVVWNVVAAPATSLVLKTWCFPVTGCIGYRGYFEEDGAKAMAAELKSQGLEVSVYGVPAYSTLGWLNWAGGDPLLNTFINYPDAELARLIFHELAHQVAFAKDDTMFNESFATAVERMGGRQWQAARTSTDAGDEFNANSGRRTQFRALTLATRTALNEIYRSGKPEQEMLAMKSSAYASFRTQYAALKAQWISTSTLSEQAATRQLGGYDQWVADANNASFAAQAAYDELVPEFENLYAQLAQQPGPAWQRFYDAVKRLADMPLAERRAALKNPK
jgi:predicted aminopeptidase